MREDLPRRIGFWGGAGIMVGVMIGSGIFRTPTSIAQGLGDTRLILLMWLLFRFLGHVHSRHQTPDVSLRFQALLSCVAICFLRQFERLTGGFVFTMWIFYAAAAVAMIVLRVRRPDLPRPYRCWGYPTVPALIIGVSACLPGCVLPFPPAYLGGRASCPPASMPPPPTRQTQTP